MARRVSINPLKYGDLTAVRFLMLALAIRLPPRLTAPCAFQLAMAMPSGDRSHPRKSSEMADACQYISFISAT